MNDSIFEDIALLSRQVYNTLSMLDEMLMAGTIKVLFFPVTNIDKDLPEAILKDGLGGLSVVPYKGEYQAPDFKGPNLQDIQQYISAIQFYISQIFAKIGMTEDREKNFTQSGSAKLLEFRKTELFLKQFANQLANTEKQIFKILNRWEGGTDEGIDVKYVANIVQEDIDTKLSRMAQGLTVPLKSVEKAIYKRIPNDIIPDLTEEEKKEINDEIDNLGSEPLPGILKPEIGNVA